MCINSETNLTLGRARTASLPRPCAHQQTVLAAAPTPRRREVRKRDGLWCMCIPHEIYQPSKTQHGLLPPPTLLPLRLRLPWAVIGVVRRASSGVGVLRGSRLSPRRCRRRRAIRPGALLGLCPRRRRCRGSRRADRIAATSSATRWLASQSDDAALATRS